MMLVPFALNKYYGYEVACNEDLQSIGYIGLCKAAATYKSETRVKFSTYAVSCIKNEVSKHFITMHRQARNNGVIDYSLNQRVHFNDTDETLELQDIVLDVGTDVETMALNNVLCESVKDLTPTFNMLDSASMTLREAAKVTNLSRQGVLNKMNRELRRARFELTKNHSMMYT